MSEPCRGCQKEIESLQKGLSLARKECERLERQRDEARAVANACNAETNRIVRKTGFFTEVPKLPWKDRKEES